MDASDGYQNVYSASISWQFSHSFFQSCAFSRQVRF